MCHARTREPENQAEFPGYGSIQPPNRSRLSTIRPDHIPEDFNCCASRDDDPIFQTLSFPFLSFFACPGRNDTVAAALGRECRNQHDHGHSRAASIAPCRVVSSPVAQPWTLGMPSHPLTPRKAVEVVNKLQQAHHATLTGHHPWTGKYHGHRTGHNGFSASLLFQDIPEWEYGGHGK